MKPRVRRDIRARSKRNDGQVGSLRGRWNDLQDWQARLWQPQSAFTVRDLVNVARAEDPDARLERIYEWYFSRTMTAIRVAYGAAVGVAAALYGLVKGQTCNVSEAVLSYGLTVAGAVCLIAGVVQRRELVQLHREFTDALGLLGELRALPSGRLREVAHSSARSVAADAPSSGPRWPLWWWGAMIVVPPALLAVTSVPAVTTLPHGCATTPVRALILLAMLVPLIAAPHVLAEVRRPRDDAEPCDGTASARPSAVVAAPAASLEHVLDLRLDDYVLQHAQREKVRTAIANEPPERRTLTEWLRGWL
jgi:hypothetical protein